MHTTLGALQPTCKANIFAHAAAAIFAANLRLSPAEEFTRL